MNHVPTNILYVITDLDTGGVPLHLLRLALAMHDRGRSVTVVSLAPAGPVGQMLVEKGVPVESCEGRGGFDLRVVSRLARLLRRHEPDIVHAMLFHANLAARWAARLADIPADRVVCEIQTVEIERRWHLLVDCLTHSGCRFTIGNAPSVVDHLAGTACIPRERLRLVRGGIDPARITTATKADRVDLGVQPDDRIVLWVGRLDPVKGLQTLIDAFADVAVKCAVHLLLVGGGPQRDVLQERVAALGLSDRVRFLGPRDDVPSLLKAADLFAFPSRTEGLPNALLEAMAAGCPIVTTDVPGCRDLIQNDRTGLLVPPDDTSSRASAMEALLTDRERARHLGDAAATAAANQWHIHDTLAAYESVYQEVTCGH